jgi:hypothetical protein
MTDEERQRLIARFKSHEVVMWTDIDLAADEIERLAQELSHREIDIETQADEIKRLARIVEDYKMTFGDIHEVVMGAGITHD